MIKDTLISWHPKAVLTDASGMSANQEQAQNACAKENCDPLKPVIALPEFIAAIAAADVPIMGTCYLAKRHGIKGDFLTQTGGSTGAPKVILRSSESWINSFQIIAQKMHIGVGAQVAALGHLNHSLSLYAALEALHLGAHFHALGGLEPSIYAKTLCERSITHLYATPTQLKIIRSGVVNSVTHVLVGGGIMTPQLKRHAQARFPNAEIVQFYGAAETSFVTLSDAQTPDDSTGKAFPYVTVKIRTSNGHACKIGDTGHIWVKSPLVFKNYLSDNPNGVHRDGDFVSAGEIGYMDENGYLYLRGRADRAINIADQIVYLDQVECTIAAIDGISNVAVLSIPDNLRGHSLVVFVQIEKNEELIRNKILGTLPNHLRLNKIIEISSWPLLVSGKTDYTYLEGQIE